MRQRHGGIVGVDQKQCVQQVLDLQLLVTFQAFRLNLVNAHGHIGLDAFRDRDHIVHIAVFDDDQSHDDLGQRTGVHLHIRIVGIDHRVGGGLIEKRGQGGIQLPLTACQRGHAVDGAAALLNTHLAEGDVRGLGGHICRLRGQGFQGLGGLHLSRDGHEKALSRQEERQQQGKTSEFFHNYPSRSHHRTCPAKKNRV